MSRSKCKKKQSSFLVNQLGCVVGLAVIRIFLLTKRKHKQKNGKQNKSTIECRHQTWSKIVNLTATKLARPPSKRYSHIHTCLCCVTKSRRWRRRRKPRVVPSETSWAQVNDLIAICGSPLRGVQRRRGREKRSRRRRRRPKLVERVKSRMQPRPTRMGFLSFGVIFLLFSLL